VILAETGVSIFEQAFSNFWLVLLLKTIAVMGFFLVVPLGIGYIEHKGLAHMQARLGPMEAGRFHGWAQLVADGVKFIQKEDVVPAAADRNVFSLRTSRSWWSCRSATRCSRRISMSASSSCSRCPASP
jgi:NADH:ubiquinone oxidoreductase subunit H